MNIYRVIGDRIGTLEARDLAQQLVEWHYTMVRHLRVTAPRGTKCEDGCPHEEARTLWSAARAVFGDRASDLGFLKRYGRPASRVDHGAYRALA